MSLYNDYEVIKKLLHDNIKAPYVSVKISTLGGVDRASIYIYISLDKPEAWQYDIFENSRYAIIELDEAGQLECLTKYSRDYKFRASNIRGDYNNIILKINNFIEKINPEIIIFPAEKK